MDTACIVVITTCHEREEAEKIINILFEKQLIACAQMQQIQSTYVWDNKINKEHEIKIEMKAQRKNYAAIEDVITKNHSYQVPEIIAYDISQGLPTYIDWIRQVTI